ncbi:hypothetical protein HETIRDRAFT_429324 [Heterobasidion irregulare TC 32-1]|uniref:C2H2-type domain-containing protein n=1 Tax=Heterobasidion irregulare (strain TC 32-1) TaxID=747525 RepID=W4JZQ6_HETIT|nr:uncharacterized protein HETIRDRAFT_429324 [Heterobasidion irregulare TC 32-1]ETW78321.1 hypothetical protein HETIRDRAFT_429324 [Heterobasidion irregulare TC 32-1]
MNFPDDLLYTQRHFPLATYPGWVLEPHIHDDQYASFPNVHPRDHQMPTSYMRAGTAQGQFPDDTGFGSVPGVDVASSSAGYAQACLDTLVAPVGIYSSAISTHVGKYGSHKQQGYDKHGGDAVISLEAGCRNPDHAKATYIYNNGRNGNHLPIDIRPDTSLSEALPAPFVEVQVREDKESSSRNGEKTRKQKGGLHGEGPHICKVDGKVFRHRGDLVRHRKTKLGHAEYQGPVICVCLQEFSRRDGLHTDLKAKRCHGPLSSSR